MIKIDNDNDDDLDDTGTNCNENNYKKEIPARFRVL